ncbi:hypothetical protein ACJRO7_015856 [Eucalyptus globulus]|uniref:Uncharacterized protein n=1 Tax=Eucalyptus globulus TaxID=34317 RepID=A0ABD3L5X2_EUCGL
MYKVRGGTKWSVLTYDLQKLDKVVGNYVDKVLCKIRLSDIRAYPTPAVSGCINHCPCGWQTTLSCKVKELETRFEKLEELTGHKL